MNTNKNIVRFEGDTLWLGMVVGDPAEYYTELLRAMMLVGRMYANVSDKEFYADAIDTLFFTVGEGLAGKQAP